MKWSPVFSPQHTMEWRAPVLCWTQGRTSDTSDISDISATAGWTFSSVIVLSSTALVASYNYWSSGVLDSGDCNNCLLLSELSLSSKDHHASLAWPAPTLTVVTTKHHHFSYLYPAMDQIQPPHHFILHFDLRVRFLRCRQTPIEFMLMLELWFMHELLNISLNKTCSVSTSCYKTSQKKFK